jgi:hypothetical protein
LATAFSHHSADRLLARTGLLPTTTHTGFVWLDGRIRRQTQLLSFTGTRKVTSRSVPSASTSCRATGRPLTTTSTGTVRVSPTRARSRSQ